MERFLIVKTSSIGDVLQALPVVDYLKSRFPGCQVDWVAEKGVAPIVRGHPKVDRTISVDTRKWRTNPFAYWKEIFSFSRHLRAIRYDALFDLQGNSKSGVITAIAAARKKVGYSWNHVAERPNVLATNIYLPARKEDSVRERYLRLLMDYFGDIDFPKSEPFSLGLTDIDEERLLRLSKLGIAEPKLMVCFGSNWKNKQLTEASLLAFLKQIDQDLAPTFFFVHGNEREKRQAESLEKEFPKKGFAVGDMSLSLWQRLMEKMDAVIATDSAALHLVATTRTPSFSFFGPSSSRAYKPDGETHAAFQGECPYGVQYDHRCPKLRTCETGACIRGAAPDELYSHFKKFWEQASKSLAHS